MPRTIAENIARCVSRCDTAEAAREAAEMTLRIAVENGYDQKSVSIVKEVCEHLRRLAAEEPDAGCKQRILDAIQVVCDAADESRRR